MDDQDTKSKLKNRDDSNSWYNRALDQGYTQFGWDGPLVLHTQMVECFPRLVSLNPTKGSSSFFLEKRVVLGRCSLVVWCAFALLPRCYTQCISSLFSFHFPNVILVAIVLSLTGPASASLWWFLCLTSLLLSRKLKFGHDLKKHLELLGVSLLNSTRWSLQ